MTASVGIWVKRSREGATMPVIIAAMAGSGASVFLSAGALAHVENVALRAAWSVPGEPEIIG